jgi:gamma-glutamyltranspeptidase / glutathione hydrolase
MPHIVEREVSGYSALANGAGRRIDFRAMRAPRHKSARQEESKAIMRSGGLFFGKPVFRKPVFRKTGSSKLGFGKVLALAVLGLAMTAPNADAQQTPLAAPGIERAQTRSMVITQDGIVAAESPLASQAGVQILRNGGNAVDAAIAANAVMGVVAPMSNGIGGDLFVMYYDAKTGKLYGLNASGWAPAGLNAQFLRDKGFRDMPQRGIYSATVPGAVDGWDKLLSRFGTKKFPEVLAPAIHIAEQGFPVTEWIASLWAASANGLRESEESAQTYLINDQPPHVGQLFRNPDLAWSLRQIATGGRDAYYKGEIAKRIVAASQKHDGVMTMDDLAQFSSEWADPISTTYRGWTVYEMPPNGQGVAALEMLNIMETFPLNDPKQFQLNQTNTLHIMIEAKKLAYADLQKYIGEPKNNPQVMREAMAMLQKPYAAERAKQIDMNKANCDVAAGNPMPAGGDTIYLSVVDRDGNMVSLIQSNYENFGSGVVPQGVGFVLHDRGGLFSLDANSPNVLAGHKRPLHTIIPAFMENGNIRIAFGIMGGWNQSQAHAQFVSHIVDFKQNIQLAMETARFTKSTFEGCDVELENRIPGNVRAELTAKGHLLTMRNGYSNRFGGGQAVMRDFSTGTNFGASDPRKDGEAIPEVRY